MANMIANPANVDDGKRPHVAAMLDLNGRHTAGSVTIGIPAVRHSDTGQESPLGTFMYRFSAVC